MKKYQVKIQFIRDILGSQPASEDLRKKYITAKMMTGRTGVSAEIAMQKVEGEIENLQKDEAYLKTVEDIGDKSLTVFFRDVNGTPSISDVQIRGFMKDAFAFVGKEEKLLKKSSGEAYSSDDSYRRWIGERLCFLQQYFPLTGVVDALSRPIRVMTPQGHRVSITSSERVKAPSSIMVEFQTTDDVQKEWIEKVLNRGMFKGISQWANAQYGTFTYEMMQVK
jgi:hypothetical protein